MILRDAVERYVAWRRTHGAGFETGARLLRYFCRHVGGNVACKAVGEADVLAFLAGDGPLTRYRANKYGALAGFYRYAISRGYAVRSPLPAPDEEPRRPRSAPPYVYSHEELQRLFGAIDISRKYPVQLDGDTLRALLLLLYGAGLRLGEALRLTLDDTDLHDAVLTIRNAKFYQEPPRSRLSTTCRCSQGLWRPARGAPLARRRSLDLPRKPRRHALNRGTVRYAFSSCSGRPGSAPGTTDGGPRASIRCATRRP